MTLVAYMRKLDVLNRGFGGYTTEWVKCIFDDIFAKKDEAANVPRMRMITMWFGV